MNTCPLRTSKEPTKWTTSIAWIQTRWCCSGSSIYYGERAAGLLVRNKRAHIDETLFPQVFKTRIIHGWYFDGILPNESADMTSPQHHRIVWGNINSLSHDASEQGLTKTFTIKGLDERLNITAMEDIFDANEAVTRIWKGGRARKPPWIREGSLGLLPVHLFLSRHVHFISDMFSDPSLFEMCQQDSPLHWSIVWRG